MARDKDERGCRRGGGGEEQSMSRVKLWREYSCISASYVVIVIPVRPKLKLNSVAWVRERTIPTERLPLVGEFSAIFADRGVLRSQRVGSPTVKISVF
jgi:hypothetical protein